MSFTIEIFGRGPGSVSEKVNKKTRAEQKKIDENSFFFFWEVCREKNWIIQIHSALFLFLFHHELMCVCVCVHGYLLWRHSRRIWQERRKFYLLAEKEQILYFFFSWIFEGVWGKWKFYCFLRIFFLSVFYTLFSYPSFLLSQGVGKMFFCP